MLCIQINCGKKSNCTTSRVSSTKVCRFLLLRKWISLGLPNLAEPPPGFSLLEDNIAPSEKSEIETMKCSISAFEKPEGFGTITQWNERCVWLLVIIVFSPNSSLLNDPVHNGNQSDQILLTSSATPQLPSSSAKEDLQKKVHSFDPKFLFLLTIEQ